MANSWVRYKLTAELLSDTHPGSGSGGDGVDSLIARDRHGQPVIWASHIEGVLRDAARRLKGDAEAEGFFGRAGGEKQRAVFTSFYTQEAPKSRIWRSTARKAFDNRTPKADTLRVIEFVPKGTRFVGEVELLESDLPVLQRLAQEVDALGTGRATGSGRVKLSLEKLGIEPRSIDGATGRLLLLLKNRDPLCITATATPTNLIPGLPFVPGRALLGAIADWLLTDGHQDSASLLTFGRISVSDALPLPEMPASLESVEVLPAPLSLYSEKPAGAAGEAPWWAQPVTPTQRFDLWSANEDGKRKCKRPEDDLFVYRASSTDAWRTFRPARRVRLRNGRPDPKQADASLFAIEQIVEETLFLAELRGAPENMQQLVERLAPVLSGSRWLRVGRGGAPVEVVRLAWVNEASDAQPQERTLLILTSDLLVRDEYLRWRTALDEATLQGMAGEPIQLEKSLQDSVMVHGFNGTSRLWRMPAAAIRRGSVFEVSGPGVGKLAERVAKGEWLGERIHEGFGRFRLDTTLPGVTGEQQVSSGIAPRPDDPQDSVAAETKEWFDQHKILAQMDGERKPSLSQWMDLVADLERNDAQAIEKRLNTTTAGARSWRHEDAVAVLRKLNEIQPEQRAVYAQYFVRWLRVGLRANRDQQQDKEAA